MAALAGVSHGNSRNSGSRFVRLIRIAAVVSTLLVSAPAFAQGWFEYRDLAERFQVNLPGEPAIEEITYTSWQGATLPARVYTVEDGPSRYSVTVVNYSSDEEVTDVLGSIAHEAWKVRRRGGEITYDAFAQTDRIAGHELYITNADESRTLVRLFLHAKRLYILEATVSRGAPPPLLFPQSLQILDENGDRIRYQVDADGQRIERRPRNRADR